MKRDKKIQDFECKEGVFMKCSRCGKKITKGKRIGQMYTKKEKPIYLCEGKDGCFGKYIYF